MSTKVSAVLNVLVTLSATVVTLWMLIDAVRRRVDSYWYFIILTPLGEWVYFFAVKIHDYDLAKIKKMFLERPPSVDEMRQRLEETPSDENKVMLGKSLYDAKKFEEAAKLFDEVLDRDEHDKDALYGKALCLVNREELDRAVAQLSSLIEIDPTFGDYEPWFDLAFAQWQLHRKPEAVQILDELVKTSPRIKHKVILGKYLVRSGEPARGRTIIEEALDDYANSNSFIKRTSGRWIQEARDTLTEAKKADRS